MTKLTKCSKIDEVISIIMWTENKTSAPERTKILNSGDNIKKERYIFDSKIMASKELTETEKKIFIEDLSKIPDSEFKEKYNFIIKNYKEIVKWIQLKWSIDNFVELFEEIENNLTWLKNKSRQLVREKQEKLNQKERLSAEASIDHNLLF